MSRLVDADALIEAIKESRPLNWTDSESEIQEDADYNHFIEMVNAQPTAYSIEKVVAELGYQKEQCEKDMKYYEGKPWKDHISHTNYDLFYAESECYEEAINIVKRGGVE